MTDSFEILEQKVADRVKHVLSEEFLSTEIRLLDQFSSIDFDGFFNVSDLLGFCIDLSNDEAVILKSIKSWLASDFEISSDHAFVKRTDPIQLEKIEAINGRMLYMESIPEHYTMTMIKALFPEFANMKIITPLPLHLSLKGNILIPKNVFLLFESEADANNAILKFDTTPLEEGSVAEFFQNGKNMFKKLRVMKRQDWLNRMREYKHLQELGNECLKRKRIERESTRKAEFESGVVAKFFHVCPETTTLTLKNLFDLVSPVSFIDFERPNTWGYVRFKSAHGANDAIHYFKNIPVYQTGKTDIGSLTHSSSHSKNSNAVIKRINLEMLDENQEKEYWFRIEEIQNQKLALKLIPKRQKGVHISFSDDDMDSEHSDSIE